MTGNGALRLQVCMQMRLCQALESLIRAFAAAGVTTGARNKNL
jgi:hypothetical protein